MSKLDNLGAIRQDWTYEEVHSLYKLSFPELLFEAHKVHRQHFDASEVQISTLLSIKTGACPENCAYCPQSGHYDTGVEKEKLLPVDDVLAAAKKAKDAGATRFCMGAGWRGPNDKHLPYLKELLEGIKELGMESCMSLGMLTAEQAKELKAGGLDYYNHNLDTSPEYYKKIISTRTYQDRLDTLENLRNADINVCCGGILGMGESVEDRIEWLLQLANLPEHPKSVPINKLIPIPGTPLENKEGFDHFEFVRFVALARIMMPASYVRLSAGRNSMNEETHALAFFAGVNSIHYGEKLFVTPLPETEKDQSMLTRLGYKPLHPEKYQQPQPAEVE